MVLLKKALDLVLWPGIAISRLLSISISEEGGQVRALVNGLVWGTILLILAVIYYH